MLGLVLGTSGVGSLLVLVLDIVGVGVGVGVGDNLVLAKSNVSFSNALSVPVFSNAL